MKSSHIVYFSAAYFIAFGAWFVYIGDHEYIWYVALILTFGWLGWRYLKHANIPPAFVGALSIAGIMHMIGRAVPVHGTILYNTMIVPIYAGIDPQDVFLKYDQLLHFYGYAVGALLIRYLIQNAAPRVEPLARATVAILAASGIGAANEVAEFIAVSMIHHTYVGDYYNTGLDLLSNLLGALVAVAAVEMYLRLKKRSE